jgi:hypothetical protein
MTGKFLGCEPNFLFLVGLDEKPDKPVLRPLRPIDLGLFWHRLGSYDVIQVDCRKAGGIGSVKQKKKRIAGGIG